PQPRFPSASRVDRRRLAPRIRFSAQWYGPVGLEASLGPNRAFPPGAVALCRPVGAEPDGDGPRLAAVPRRTIVAAMALAGRAAVGRRGGPGVGQPAFRSSGIFRHPSGVGSAARARHRATADRRTVPLHSPSLDGVSAGVSVVAADHAAGAAPPQWRAD